MSRLFDFAGSAGMGYSQPEPLLPKTSIALPPSLSRKDLPRWPRLSEPEMVRHYTWLSRRNFGIDTGFYPLGSCTMKHNPRVLMRLLRNCRASLISTHINLNTIYKVYSQSSMKCSTCLQSVREWMQ